MNNQHKTGKLSPLLNLTIVKNPVFTLKSERLSVIHFILNENNWEKAQQSFLQKAEKYLPFQGTPFVLDVSVFDVKQSDGLASFIQTLRQHGLHIIALQHHKANWSAIAQQVGCLFFGELPENWANILPEQKTPQATEPEKPAANLTETNTQTEPISMTATARRTVVVNSPVRSGQQIYAEDADLIVLGRVSEGAELIADGNIHVYAAMHGRALAGDKGDKNARIFIQSMQAELVSIAGIFRTFEQQLPAHLHKQAVRIELQENRLSIAAMNAK